MAKKNKDEELPPGLLTEQEMEYLSMMIDFLGKLPPESYLTVILSFAWSKTHEGGINQNDVLLGSLGGFTLPSALKGSHLSNAWALAYLGGLGFNFVDQDINEWIKDNSEASDAISIVSPLWLAISKYLESQEP